MSRHTTRCGVPDRWLDYSAVGKRLNGTRFIAFKVPLKQSFIRNLPRSDVFGPWELLDALNQQNQELGLIIDLTFTTRYYSLQDIPESLLCVKIFTRGHEVPSDDTILKFKRIVYRFLRDNKDNDKLIGVHCTHGLNRTGYLICRYLIDVDGMDPEEAVALFNLSRGHAIERQNYLDDLQRGPKRSNEGIKQQSEQEPKRGEAVHRPTFSDTDSESRLERRHFDEPGYQSFIPPRGPNHRSHNHHLPCPPILPPPPLHPPVSARLHPYRWTPPYPDTRRRRPQHWEDSRSIRPSPPEMRWRRPPEDRRRASPPRLPQYSPSWTSRSNGTGAEEDWTRPHMRSTQRHRSNGYDNY
ncbi:RNA/RNP complex-1-interacting phosphatase-like [Odontesthes bonariensis]|uniref:RNA/RNP complex-1-interacting phosphatase-like n=1 Tax=Odontesthes bonariensis TaxID=219752 RepID=UPI003F58F795